MTCWAFAQSTPIPKPTMQIMISSFPSLLMKELRIVSFTLLVVQAVYMSTIRNQETPGQWIPHQLCHFFLQHCLEKQIHPVGKHMKTSSPHTNLNCIFLLLHLSVSQFMYYFIKNTNYINLTTLAYMLLTVSVVANTSSILIGASSILAEPKYLLQFTQTILFFS